MTQKRLLKSPPQKERKNDKNKGKKTTTNKGDIKKWLK